MEQIRLAASKHPSFGVLLVKCRDPFGQITKRRPQLDRQPLGLGIVDKTVHEPPVEHAGQQFHALPVKTELNFRRELARTVEEGTIVFIPRLLALLCDPLIG
jgi:hypothetical protein